MFALIRKAAVLAACVAAVALVYRSAGQSGTAVGGTPCLAAETAEAARAGTPTPASAYVLPDDEAQCRLRRALLTTSDVPSNWEEGRGNPRHVYGDEDVDCGTPLPAVVAGLTTEFFTDDAVGASEGMFQRVYAFQSGGAGDLMVALKRNCALIAERHDSRYSLLNLPALGDESVGLRLKWSSDDIGPPFGIVYIRHDDLVTIVMLVTDGDLGDGLTDVGQLAAERLGRVGPMPEPTYVAGEGCYPSPTPRAAVVEKLSGGLLTLDDMPVGWVRDPPGPCGRINEEGDCKNSGNPPPEPLSITTTGFRGGREVYVANRVEIYEGDEARTLIDGVRRALPAECLVSATGQQHGKHWDPIDVPALGDDAVAWHFTTRGLPTEADYYVILIRRGRSIASVAFRPERNPFRREETIPLDFTLLAKRADSRLASIQDKLRGD